MYSRWLVTDSCTWLLGVHGEVHQIMCLDKQHVVAVEKNRVLLPPTYNRYFAWGYPDRSARVAVMEKDGEKVRGGV